MKQLIYIIVLIISISTITCKRDDRIFSTIDTLIETRPDSALTLLEKINTDDVNDYDRARAALLTTKAKFKNHEQTADDSIIGMSAEYFEGRNDSLEIQSLYYSGATSSMNGIYDKALVKLHKAYDKAMKTDDKFYAAMSARELSNVYGNIFMVEKELEWARTALKRFKEASKPQHAAWMDVDIIHALIYNGMYEEALSAIETIDSTLYNNDTSFRHEILRSKVEALWKINRYEELNATYAALSTDGYEADAHDCCILTHMNILNGNNENAAYYLEMAESLAQEQSDSLYIYKLRGLLLSRKGDYASAYENASILYEKLMEIDEKLLSRPFTTLLTETYHMQVENERLRAEHNHLTAIFISLICAIILIMTLCIFIYYRSRLTQKRLEAEKFMNEIETLRCDLKFSENRLSETERSVEKEKALKNERFRKEVSDIFANHRAVLDRMSEVWYRNPASDKDSRMHRELLESIKHFGNIDVLENLATIIDKYNNDWLSRFKAMYPGLSKSEYTLAIYLYIGFRTETIAVMMNKPTTKAVHTAKYKLKQKLILNETSEAYDIMREMHLV